MEHHSNLIPWQMTAQATGAKLQFVPITADGMLDMSKFDQLLTQRTKLVAITGMSNVLGTIFPVREIAKKAAAVGAKFLVDGAQSVPHLETSVEDLGCDFLAFSAHKMLGPTGVGVLYGRPELLDAMDPYQGGGDMILEVWRDHARWNELPWKFEAGTPNIGGVVGFGAAIDYLNHLGMAAVRQHEKELTAYALDQLRQDPQSSSLRSARMPETAAASFRSIMARSILMISGRCWIRKGSPSARGIIAASRSCAISGSAGRPGPAFIFIMIRTTWMR